MTFSLHRLKSYLHFIPLFIKPVLLGLVILTAVWYFVLQKPLFKLLYGKKTDMELVISDADRFTDIS
ncbi:MAG: hypothetical protein LBU87_01615, partial [Lactobacillales bacterium]|nr:hypothetical protein [Lactobacillales bacterium]